MLHGTKEKNLGCEKQEQKRETQTEQYKIRKKSV